MGESSMICETLNNLVKSGALTIGRIARCWQLADHSVYPYLSGDRVPTWDRVAQLFDVATPEVQAAIIAALTDGSGWVATHIDADLDLNSDGDVDTIDAMHASGDAAMNFGHLVHTMSDSIDDGRIDEVELQQIMTTGRKTIESVSVTMQIAQDVHARGVRRRKCKRPLTVGMGGAR